MVLDAYECMYITSALMMYLQLLVTFGN